MLKNCEIGLNQFLRNYFEVARAGRVKNMKLVISFYKYKFIKKNLFSLKLENFE